jgi:hypothetical protein
MNELRETFKEVKNEQMFKSGLEKLNEIEREKREERRLKKFPKFVRPFAKIWKTKT